MGGTGIMKAFFQKHKNLAENILLLVVLAAGCLWMHHQYGQQQMQQEIAEKILRFHVRANSNSKKDQELKLKVRDAVGAYMQRELAGVENLTECTAVVNSHLTDIIAAARQVVTKEGYDYPVTAQVETVDFPQKTYGDYTFPAGDYQALDVVIGSGKGKNWWCVMYPNMCFQGAVYEIVQEDAKESLQQVLSQDEYDAVLKSRNYQIRFKYLDFLNGIFPKLRK